MRRQPLILFALLLTISGATMWARWPVAQPVAASEPSAIAQTSLPATPTTTPTPLAPMPTPSMTRQVESDWQRYTSPYLGFTFRYPPGWRVEGPETYNARHDELTEEAKYARAIGAPIWLYPSSGESGAGAIYLILDSYRRLPETPLTEWILLRLSYSDLLGPVSGSGLQLATVPAEYLPEGIDEGRYAVNNFSINPPKTFWLQRGDLVYHFNSTYHRPEDIAIILAVMQSLEFESSVEAKLREANQFYGDDDTLRQKIAQAQADSEANPSCDAHCEYVKFMTEVERWKKLPAPERPLVQPIRFGAIDDSWQPYTQTLMGISFRYAPGLEVVDPFAKNNLDESSLFDEAILIKWAGVSWIEEVMTIELFPYMISDDIPINNWEAIQDQLDRARNPLNRFQYRLIVPIEWNKVAHHLDDIVHTQDQAPYYRIETFWISKDGVVFRITSSYPPLAGYVPLIISTIEFDTARLEELRSMGIFAGDERSMVAELQEAWANPLPTVDPQATATPIPTMTPLPTATPTPIIRLTVTPSAFESPLVNGRRRYEGISSYNGYPNFELWFDPTIWQWSTNEQGGNYFVHQTIPGCEISPQGWATHVIPLAPVTLAGVAWSISYFPTHAGEFLAYTRGWSNASYTVLLSLPTPSLEVYDPDNKSQCELDAETVIATHKVLAREQAIPLPTVTPTPN